MWQWINTRLDKDKISSIPSDLPRRSDEGWRRGGGNRRNDMVLDTRNDTGQDTQEDEFVKQEHMEDATKNREDGPLSDPPITPPPHSPNNSPTVSLTIFASNLASNLSLVGAWNCTTSGTVSPVGVCVVVGVGPG
jgi:hypothetical protein